MDPVRLTISLRTVAANVRLTLDHVMRHITQKVQGLGDY